MSFNQIANLLFSAKASKRFLLKSETLRLEATPAIPSSLMLLKKVSMLSKRERVGGMKVVDKSRLDGRVRE